MNVNHVRWLQLDVQFTELCRSVVSVAAFEGDPKRRICILTPAGRGCFQREQLVVHRARRGVHTHQVAELHVGIDFCSIDARDASVHVGERNHHQCARSGLLI